MALPSLKEGWGLVIGEAGTYGTPTVAYRSAGGTRESIEEGRSGLLADDLDEFVAELRSVLTDAVRREALGRRAGHEPPLHVVARPGVVRAGDRRRWRVRG